MGKRPPSFEAALKRLEVIVSELEKSDVSLDRTVKLFEEGRELSRQCQRELTAVERRVSKLVEKEGEGAALEEFEEREEGGEEG